MLARADDPRKQTVEYADRTGYRIIETLGAKAMAWVGHPNPLAS